MRAWIVLALAVIVAGIAGVAASSHNADHEVMAITRYPWLTGLVAGLVALAVGCLFVIALAIERQRRP